MYPPTFKAPALSHDVLDLVYPAPRAGRNPECNLRLHHRDLPLRSLGDLQREHERLAARIALEAGASEWMVTRLARICAELAARAR
jgi:hypothetical protein